MKIYNKKIGKAELIKMNPIIRVFIILAISALMLTIIIAIVLSIQKKSPEFDVEFIENYFDDGEGAYIINKVKNSAVQHASGEVIIYNMYDDGKHGEHKVVGIRKNAFETTENVQYVVLSSNIEFIEEGAFNGTSLFDPDAEDGLIFVGFPAAENSLSSTSGNFDLGGKYNLWLLKADISASQTDLIGFQNYTGYNGWHGELSGIANNAFENSNNLTLLLPSTVDNIQGAFKALTHVNVYSMCEPGIEIKGEEEDNVKVYYYEDANKHSTYDCLKWNYEGTAGEKIPTPKKYSVIFNSNGGSAVKSVDKRCGENINRKELQEPIREHYKFAGWYSDIDLSNEVVSASMPGKDLTLYAKWVAVDYRITFVADGMTVASRSFNIETDYIDEPNVPNKKGYSGEWEEYNFISQENGFIACDFSVNALYVPIKYSIKYNIVGPYDIDDPINHNSTSYTIEDETKMLSPASKTGYTFIKWTKDGQDITEIVAGSYGDITLTAVWEPITYMIEYQNAPINSNTTNYTVETETFPLVVPGKTGYDFVGWSDDGELITEIRQGSYGDKTITANWSVHIYTITYLGVNGDYDVDEPLNPNATSYTIEDETKTLSPASKTGYNFIQWNKEDGQRITEIVAGSYGDITLTAHWETITYNICYELNGGINVTNPNSFTVESVASGIALNDPSRDGGNIIEYQLNSDGNFTVIRDSYNFKGWYNNADFYGDAVSEISLGLLGDLRLYAKWEKQEIVSQEPYIIQEDTIYFGMYPQTRITDGATIVKLGGFDNTWTSYEYLINDSITEFMYYKDVILDGVKYRGVYFTKYRPYMCAYSGIAGNSFQDDNGYYTSTIYWFKYEPIEWKIIQSDDSQVTLVSSLMLDAQQYDYQSDGSYSDKYFYDSTIYEWLNKEFVNNAFNSMQKTLICADVLLPSIEEAGNINEIAHTDYAESQGIEKNAPMWLRGTELYNLNAPVVIDNTYSTRFCYRTSCGILPVVKIKI